MEFSPAMSRLAEPSLRARPPAAACRLRALPRALASLVLLLCSYGHAPAQTSQSAPIERELRGGELHSFRLLLNPGQFVRAVFDQRGVDIVLTLAGPDGAELLRVDSPNGEWGPEPLFFEVGKGGYYTIQARARKPSAGAGRYEFAMTGRRATPLDERQFPAERVFAEASRSLAGGGADSLRAGLEKYGEAGRLFRGIGDWRAVSTTLLMMGSVSRALGDAPRALLHYEEALPLLRGARDAGGEARALAAVGQLYFSLGDRERALEHFRRALSILREAGDSRTAAYTLNNIAHTFDAMGEEREALAHYEQALALFREAGDRRGEALALNNVGLVYGSLGEKKKAREHYELALKAFDLADSCREIGPALSNLAHDSLQNGDRQKALEYLEQALAIQRGALDREGEATTLNNIGFVHHAAGERARALEYFHRALAAQREVADRRGEGDTLGNLMYAWRAQRRAELAIFYGKQAVAAYQEVRAALPPLDKEAQKSFLQPRELAYRRLAELLIERGRVLEAQQVVGLLKEEEYFQFVRRNSGEGSALAQPPAMTPAEASFEKRYVEASEQIAVRGRKRAELLGKSARTPEEERQLVKLDSEITAANAAFQSFLDQLSAELGDTKQAARVDAVRDSQGLMEDLRELGNGAVAIYTLVGEEKYRVILITPDVQLAREYPIKAADLYKKIAAFREALQNPSADPRPQAQDLYRVMVGPIARELESAHAETLMWSLDGALRYVPVAALYDGERYMVERYRNTVFTLASMARLKDEPSASWKGLGFGVSKALGEFAALPAVPEELRGIIRDEKADGARGVLPGRISLDEAFTEESLKTGLQQRFPLVHVASHFQFQPGNETASFLLLGDGTRLSLAQLKSAQNLFGGVELLTLSACDTASGGAGADGKEVEGFGVLAQRQGAKAVMATLWPVADASTRLLMQEFYSLRDARAGTLKAEALRRAQLALLRGEATAGSAASVEDHGASATARRGLSGEAVAGSRARAPYAHPYFWAPFILIGNWR
jgi:CHAT domain-containing protein/Tfp pilus assembly protein PilF